MSTYYICEHCVRFYKGIQSKCPHCDKDIVDQQALYREQNPFDRKPVLTAGSVRIGKPLTYKKETFELFVNFVISVTILVASVFLISGIDDPVYRLGSMILLVIYLVAAYWVHPQPDHESIQDGEWYWFRHKYHFINWDLILLAALLLPGQYLLSSIIGIMPTRGQ
jgi:hypothetical protein